MKSSPGRWHQDKDTCSLQAKPRHAAPPLEPVRQSFAETFAEAKTRVSETFNSLGAMAELRSDPRRFPRGRTPAAPKLPGRGPRRQRETKGEREREKARERESERERERERERARPRPDLLLFTSRYF